MFGKLISKLQLSKSPAEREGQLDTVSEYVKVVNMCSVNILCSIIFYLRLLKALHGHIYIYMYEVAIQLYVGIHIQY